MGFRRLMGRRADSGSAPWRTRQARLGARRMTVAALIVAAGKGERARRRRAQAISAVGGKPVLRWAVEVADRPPAMPIGARGRWRRTGGSARERTRRPRRWRTRSPVVQSARTRCERRSALAEFGTPCWSTMPPGPFCPPDVIDRLLASARVLRQARCPCSRSRHACRASARLSASRSTATACAASRRRRPSAAQHLSLRLRAWPATRRPTRRRWRGPPDSRVAAVEGDPSAREADAPRRLRRAEQWLAGRLAPRTGIGFDVHAFAGEGPLMLGGIEFRTPRACRPQRRRRRACTRSPMRCSAPPASATSASTFRRPIRAGRARHRHIFLAPCRRSAPRRWTR